MSVPQLTPALLHKIDQQFPGFMDWYNLLMVFLRTKFDTEGDVRLLTPAKGLIMTNVSGNNTRRLRLSDDGLGLILEDA